MKNHAPLSASKKKTAPLKGKRVLVTGAGGFIGGHLTERLVRLGNRVTCFLRYNSRNDPGLLSLISRSIRQEIKVIAGDLRDGDAVRRAVQGQEVIYHLGALIAIPYSYLHPVEVVETNILGTLNILQAGREVGVEKIVHTSTSEVYGTAKYVPIDEKHPLQAQSPYAASKIGADKLAESFHLTYGLPVATIRPFNTYGPRQSTRAVIPTIIVQALAGRRITLGALGPTRDFTYVDDVIRGFIHIGESPDAVGQVFNLGSNLEISIGDLVKKIATILGRGAAVRQDQKRIRPSRSEVQRLWADNTRAGKLLDWRPEISLDEGLRRTIAWYSKNRGRFHPEVYHV